LTDYLIAVFISLSLSTANISFLYTGI